jgi:hypothetical protein
MPQRIEEDAVKGITTRPQCQGALVRLVLQASLMYALFKIRRKYVPVVRIIPTPGAGFGMQYLGYVKNGDPIEKMKRRRWRPEFGPLCAYLGELLTGDDMNVQLENGNNYLAKLSALAVIDSTSPYFGNLAAFINRSCMPNVHFARWLMDEKAHLLIELKKGAVLKPGNHITAFYPLTKGIECLCWRIGGWSQAHCWGTQTDKEALRLPSADEDDDESVSSASSKRSRDAKKPRGAKKS